MSSDNDIEIPDNIEIPDDLRRSSIYNTDLDNNENVQIDKITEFRNKMTKTKSENTTAFVVKLLNRLKNPNDRCFYKGAFVFADTNELTLTTMLFNETATIVPKLVESHKKYCSEDNNKKWYDTNMVTLKNITNKNGIKFLKVLMVPHVYEVHISPTEHKCTCDNNKVLKYQNVKWYPFIGDDNNNYVFLKLEGYPTMDLLHLWNWIVRHSNEKKDKLKTKLASMVKKGNTVEQTNKSICKTHREDCDHCSYTESRDGTNNNYVLMSDNDKGEIYNYPYTFKRDGNPITRGDEIFVPASTLTEILQENNTGGRKIRRKISGHKTRRKAGGRKTRRKISGHKTRRKAGGRKTRRKFYKD